MSISPDFKSDIEKLLSRELNLQVSILNNQSVGGGCINHAHQIETNHGNYFMKWNDATAYPGMFESEAKGLQLLRSVNAIYIPEVIATGQSGNTSYIILEWIESGKRKKDFWHNFGEHLAKLHRHTSTRFGLDHDNYIGSLSQSNRQHKNWIEFFIHERIEPQLKLASGNGQLATSLTSILANLENKLAEIIPKEAPALLHGDLWNGNYMIAPDGSACLIDPAVYYGHREMDLAMTKLFGGFDPGFYEAYNETFTLQKGFESRIDIYNLYPLLVHVNLFGGGYVGQVRRILQRFGF